MLAWYVEDYFRSRTVFWGLLVLLLHRLELGAENEGYIDEGYIGYQLYLGREVSNWVKILAYDQLDINFHDKDLSRGLQVQ